MPVQRGVTVVSTSASALVGHTRAAAVLVTPSTRTRGPALVSVSLPVPSSLASRISLCSRLSLAAHLSSPSLTSDRLLQLRKPQLPARVREHPQRALLPLPQRVHAAARQQVLQGYVLARHGLQCTAETLPCRSPGEGLFLGHAAWTGITLCPWRVFQPPTSATGWITAASSSARARRAPTAACAPRASSSRLMARRAAVSTWTWRLASSSSGLSAPGEGLPGAGLGSKRDFV